MIIHIVLNLIINGIPSIPNGQLFDIGHNYCFKPYYKWNTFNTDAAKGGYALKDINVLNLIINGIPSIQ